MIHMRAARLPQAKGLCLVILPHTVPRSAPRSHAGPLPPSRGYATNFNPPPYLRPSNDGPAPEADFEKLYARLDSIEGAKARENRIQQSAKTWGSLGVGEKTSRVFIQTSSLLVVLAGGLLAGMVFYTTGTELWSYNSPTRIYEDCIERVKQDKEVTSLLLPPLVFYSSPPSSHLRRARQVNATTAIDPVDGRELLFVRLWVEGRNAQAEAPDQDWFYRLKTWVGPLIWEDSNRAGSYVPRPTHPAPAPPPAPSYWSGLLRAITGIFAFSPAASNPTPLTLKHKPAPGEFHTAEVTAQLKRDPASNVYVYQKLYADIPDSTSPHNYRVTIPTATDETPTQQGFNRLRIWQRSKTG